LLQINKLSPESPTQASLTKSLAQGAVLLIASSTLTACPFSDSYYIAHDTHLAGGGTSSASSAGAAGGVVATGGADGGVVATGGTTSEVVSAGGTTSAPCFLGPFGAPEVLTGLGINGGLWGPALSGDGLTLYFGVSDNTGNEHLYRARRVNRGVAFSAAERVTELGSSGSEGTPCVTPDDLTIYFYSTRSGGSGGRDLWVATRTKSTDPFGTPTALTPLNTPNLDYEPWISGDELTLYFASAGASTQSSTDIWVTTRADKSQAFSAPLRVTSLSSNSNDQRIVLSSDGLTAFFASDRTGSRGNVDIWYATRTEPLGDFGAAAPVEGLNSTANDLDPTLSRDDKELFFTSSRSGVNQLYRLVRSCL